MPENEKHVFFNKNSKVKRSDNQNSFQHLNIICLKIKNMICRVEFKGNSLLKIARK